MRAAMGVALVVWTVVLVGGVVASPLAAGSGVGPDDTATVGGADAARIPADSTVIRIRVRPDGSAVWTVQHRVDLDDENATARFETVQARIEADPLRYTGPFAERMGRAAEVAAEETGRDMAIRNVSVRARSDPTRRGVVTYRFEWTAFASKTDGRLVVGDALVGFSLAGNQTLIVQWPDGYDPRSVSPDPADTRERAVVWDGPVEFAPAEPRVVLAGGRPLRVEPLVAAGLAIAVGLVGLVGWRRYRSSGPGATGPPDDGTASADDAGSSAGGDGAGPDALLSDEEQVLSLLEANEGRMRQQAVVAELDWSETKTSEVVGKLRDAEAIEVYRLGRENVLSLPGEMDV
jgi:hypothetical protein